MTVAELIKELKKFKGDEQVTFESPDRDLFALPVVLVEEAEDEGVRRCVLISDDQ